MSRLGLGLGITKGGVIPFNPLSLDPYLLFDTQSSMIGTFENPTLDLDPATPSTLDVITASRTGVATFTDANGNIASAPANTVRVDQTQGAELTPTKFQRVGYTDFSQGWVLHNSTITLGAATAPDGTETAIKITEASATSSTYDVRHTISGGNNTFTHSVYAKQADANRHLYFEIGNTRVGVNLETGAVFFSVNNFSTGWSNPSVSVVSAGNGWFRVSLTATASSSVTSFKSKIHVATLSGSAGGIVYNGDGTSGIFIWGPQVEEGTTASSFVANTTGSPKFITGATFGPRVPMILVEPSSENLVESSDINADWGFYSNDSTITQYTSDLGGINAYVLSRIGSNQKTSLQHGNISGGSTTNATASLFYKNIGEARFFQFWDTNLSSSRFVNVDTISDEFNASAGSVKITILGDGWRRLEWTRPAHSNGKIRLSLADSLGDSRNSNFSGAGGIAFAGIQLEEGDLATSFIPTSGSTVTRAADDLKITGSAFSDFYNQSEGTLYTETIARSSATSYLFMAHGGSSANYVRVNGAGQFRIKNSGGDQVNMSIGSITLNSLARAAISYKQNDFLGSVNGGSEVSDNSGLVPTVNELQVGAFFTNIGHLNGHIKRLIYWPYHSDSL